ncbi:hypothetical protein OB905_11280 [Halobacteria archaeon AArc-dxtr1]|nr:hypothetical protein [Halobacteria archaeon AArc-dxtr1]
MTDETTTAPIPGDDEPWERLLEDARTIETEFREAGWTTVAVEPERVEPVETGERVGLRAIVSDEAYVAVEDVVSSADVTFSAVDVYYQTSGETTVVLAVERDDESEHAVLLPLYYDRTDARSALGTALEEGTLFTYVEQAGADGWVVFSHDDPSLFVEDESWYLEGDADSDPEET